VSEAAEGLLTPIIDRFRGERYFSSNFYPAPRPHRGQGRNTLIFRTPSEDDVVVFVAH
jgi:hypothetical protein